MEDAGVPSRTGEQPVRHDLEPQEADGVRPENDSKQRGAEHIAAAFEKIRVALKSDVPFGTRLEAESAAEKARCLVKVICAEETAFLKAKNEAARSEWAEARAFVDSADGSRPQERETMRSALGLICALRATLAARRSFGMLRARLAVPLALAVELEPPQPMHKMLLVIHRAGMDDYLESFQACFRRLLDVRAGQSTARRAHAQRAWEKLREALGPSPPLSAVPPKDMDEWPAWSLLFATRFVYQRARLAVLDDLDVSCFRLATRAVQLERLLHMCLHRKPHESEGAPSFANPVETAELLEGYLGDTSPDTMINLMAALANENDATTAPAQHSREGADTCREAAKEFQAHPETQDSDVRELLEALEYILDSHADMLLDPERKQRVVHELLRARYPDLYEELPKGAAPPPQGTLANEWRRLQTEFDLEAKLLDPEVFQQLLGAMGPSFEEPDSPTFTKGFSKVVVMNVIFVLQALISIGYNCRRYGSHLAVENRREAGQIVMGIVGVAMVMGLLAVTTDSLQLFYRNTVGMPQVQHPTIRYKLNAEGVVSVLGALANRTITYVPWVSYSFGVEDVASNTTIAVTLTDGKTLIVLPDYWAQVPGASTGEPFDADNSFLACMLTSHPSVTWNEVVTNNKDVGSWYPGKLTTTVPAGGAGPSVQLVSCFVMNRNAGALGPPDPEELRVQYTVAVDAFTVHREAYDRGINFWNYENGLTPQGFNALVQAFLSYLNGAPDFFDDTLKHMKSFVAPLFGSATDFANWQNAGDGPFEYESTTVTAFTETVFQETTDEAAKRRGVRTFIRATTLWQRAWSRLKMIGSFFYEAATAIWSIFSDPPKFLGGIGLAMVTKVILPADVLPYALKFAFEMLKKACSFLGSRVRPIEEFVTESYGPLWMVREALQAAWFPAPQLQVRSVRGSNKYVPAVIHVAVPLAASLLLAAVPAAPNLGLIYARHLVAQTMARALTGTERSTPMTAAMEAVYEAFLWNASSLGYGPVFLVVALSAFRTLRDLAWPEPGQNARVSNALVLSPPTAMPAVNFQNAPAHLSAHLSYLEEEIRGYLDAIRDSGYTTSMTYASLSHAIRCMIEYSELMQAPRIVSTGDTGAARKPWISHFLHVATPSIKADEILYKASQQYRHGQMMLSNSVRVLESNMRPFIHAALSTSLSRTLTVRRPLGTSKAVLRYYYETPQPSQPRQHIRNSAESRFGSDRMPYGNMSTFEDVLHYLTSTTIEKETDASAHNAEEAKTTPRTPPFELVAVLTHAKFEENVSCVEQAMLEDASKFFEYSALRKTKTGRTRIHLDTDWFPVFKNLDPEKYKIEVEIERGELLSVYCQPDLHGIAETLFGADASAIDDFLDHMFSRLQHPVFRTRVIRFYNYATEVDNHDLPVLDSSCEPLATRFNTKREALTNETYQSTSFVDRLTSNGVTPKGQVTPPYSSKVFAQFIGDILWSAYEEWSWSTSHVYDRAKARATLTAELPKLKLMLPDFRHTFEWKHPDMNEEENQRAFFFYGPWYMVV